MPPSIKRKLKIREGHRLSVKRLIDKVDENLSVISEINFKVLMPKLIRLKGNLEEKAQIILTYDKEILNSTDEENISEEIEETDQYKEIIQSALERIETSCEATSVGLHLSNENTAQVQTEPTTHDDSTTLPRHEASEGNLNKGVSSIEPVHDVPVSDNLSLLETNTQPSYSKTLKLPKLELKKFDGNLANWKNFWDTFENAIHNSNLATIEKYTYLNSLVQGSAADAIAGLPLTSENYAEAIDILKHRFGNKQLIINQHMEGLLYIESASNNIRSLRKLYDAVEAKVRALKSLGVPSDAYGCLLLSVFMTKLPAEMKLIISRDTKGEEWNLDAILQTFSLELEARERVYQLPSGESFSNTYQTAKNYKPDNNLLRSRIGSATSLLTKHLQNSNSQIICSYCRSNHPSNCCHIVTSVPARKQVLVRWGKCFNCLKKGHIVRNCPDRRRCPRCQGSHHISICPNSVNTPSTFRRDIVSRPAYDSRQSQYNENKSFHRSFNEGQQFQNLNQPHGVNERLHENQPVDTMSTFENGMISGRNGSVNSRSTYSQDARLTNSSYGNESINSPLTFTGSNCSNSYKGHGQQRLSSGNNSMVLYTNSSTPILLQTARAFIFNPSHPELRKYVRLIFDSGSQRSYICTNIKENLNLSVTGTQSVLINTFGSKSEVTPSQVMEAVDVCVATKDGNIMLSAFVVPHICDPVSHQPIRAARQTYPHLSHLQLADYISDDLDIQIDILVGADQQWNFFTGRTSRGEQGPVAMHTKLGWVLSGPVQSSTHNLLMPNKIISLFVNQSNLEDDLKRFWELEALGIKSKSIYDEFLETVQFKEGRYEVNLPWKTPHSLLPDNFELSSRRLTSLLKRLNQEPEIFQEYGAVIEEQLQRGIVEIVPDPTVGEVGKVHYLPHHPVVRRDKTTTKVRIVYDASSKSNGPSLNDCLYAGPPLTENIFDILLRFRIHPVAVVGDIEKAFLMVSVNPEDRDVLRFLWMDEHDRMICLRFTRVVFGVSSSPFLLNATIKQHIDQFKDSDPEFVRTFLKSIYVDDLSAGAKDEAAAYKLYQKAKSVLADGGFSLRKFVSNSRLLTEKLKSEEIQSEEMKLNEENSEKGISRESTHILEHEPNRNLNVNETSSGINLTEEDVESNIVDSFQIREDDESFTKSFLGNSTSADYQKVLGIGWNSAEDTLVFDMKSISRSSSDVIPTKRHVVSVASKFYDPLGLLSPFIVQYKILFQDLCKAGLEWDEPIEGELLQRFRKLMEVMSTAEVFHLPRCYFNNLLEDDVLECNLHGFSDASTRAYGAVVYLQIITASGTVTRFLASKTRVSPLVQQSIPRLELLSILILSRLMVSILQVFDQEIHIKQSFCWSDSKVALFWIKNEDKEWKQFVQNRVNEVRSLLPIQCFRHCPGKDNPADIPSRGMNPNEFLTDTQLWLEGPIWLKSQQYRYHVPDEIGDIEVTSLEDYQSEVKKKSSKDSVMLIPSEHFGSVGEVIKCEDYSDYNRLLRITGLVLVFIRRLKGRLLNTPGSPREDLDSCIVDAERLWLTENQKLLSSSSNFQKWNVEFKFFTDEHGLIRCRGRLGNAELPYTSKYPVILDSKHWITTLIVRIAHHKVLHGGVKSTLAEVRSKFWIVKGRQFIKKIIHDCKFCRRFHSKPYLPPPSPDLPEFRVQEAKAFAYIGLDYIGPVHSSDQGKLWICLFTCCITRAVHLEVVSNLTPNAFLRCFRRFTSRRSVPDVIVSDNASTFKPASKEILELMEDPTIKKFMSNQQIRWIYNLAKAPWWGGFYERLVKIIKECLKKSIFQANLNFDEILTVVAEVEAVMNSRPLSYTSSDDTDEPLTPSHLVCGHRILTLPDRTSSVELDADYSEIKQSDLTRRMKHVQTILSHFWRRWRKEYLLELRTAHRFLKKTTNNITISIGDVVLVHDEQLPRCFWKLGRVVQFVDSHDGQIRGALVKIRTKTGQIHTLRRPVQLLYPMEINEGSSNDESTTSPDASDVSMVDTQELFQRPRRSAAIVGENIRRQWIKELQSDVDS